MRGLGRFALIAVMMLAPMILAPRAGMAKQPIVMALSGWGYTYLPQMIAVELGYFDEEGIEPELISTGGGSKALAALAADQAQIYIGPPSSALRARAKGVDTYIVGADIAQYALDLIVTKQWAAAKGVTPASPYEDKVKALRGMKLAITSPGSGTDQLARYLAKQAGLDPDKDLTLTPLGTQDAAVAAFSLGRIDGMVWGQPAGQIATSSMDGVMLLDASHGQVKGLEGFLYMGVIVRESWAEKNPDLAMRCLRAMQRGLDALHSDALTTRARDAVHAKYQNKIDKAEYDALWESMRGAFPTSIEIDAGMMRRIGEFLAEFERQPVPAATLDAAWSNRYAEAARKPR